jgi:hypothetical protein
LAQASRRKFVVIFQTIVLENWVKARLATRLIFKPLPTVPAGESSDRHAPAVDEPVIPPAPVVEPAPGGNNGVAPSSSQGNDSAKLPLIHSPRLNESAKNVQYGSYFRPKR